MVNGYVIYNVTCKSTLTAKYFWSNIDSEYYSGGYVFTKEDIEKIKTIPIQRWNVQPVYMRAATWSKETGTTITGNLEAFWDEVEK